MRIYEHPSLEEVTLAQVMQALSDPCRLKIVATLIEAGAVALACNQFALDVSKATASHHFEVLRNCGVTNTEMQGTKRMTSLRREEFEARFPGIIDLVAKSV